MCDFNALRYFLCSKHTLPIIGRFEGVQMSEFGVETNEFALIFTHLFDADSIAGSEYVLPVLKTFEFVIDGFKYWFYFYFHDLNYIIINCLVKCN